MNNNFLRLFYKWSKSELAREITDSYPLLANVRNPFVMKYMDLIHDFSDPKNVYLAHLLLRIYHKSTELNLDENLTMDDIENFKKYNQPGSSGEYLNRIFIENKKLENSVLDCERKNIKKKDLKHNLLKNLADNIGDVIEDQGLFWVHEKDVGFFKIKTTIDIGGSSHSLKYWHSLQDLRENVCLLNQISILAWYGISPVTYWIGLKNSHLEKTVEIFPGICDRFFDFVKVKLVSCRSCTGQTLLTFPG